MRTTGTQAPISAFAAVKGGTDALPSGVFLTSSPFYGPSFNAANLEPAFSTIIQNVNEEDLGSRVRAILKALHGTKRLDLFMPGRLDSNYAVEHYSEVLNEMVKERKCIGLSSVDEETTRWAHDVRSPILLISICA
ncbi:hypothetical protein BC827DRAFT_1269992 [Russula dissimulans]|nr:hypothetical protein BC827DRAFT_1269992 [Russula dissimulans]